MSHRSSSNVVLVTGAAGYIGSHVCKALTRAGFEAVGLDNMEHPGMSRLPWGPLEVADTRDRPAVEAILRKYSVAGVIHLAGRAYVGESVAAPELYYHNNVTGGLALLSALRAAEVGRLVFSSSCATYGMAGPEAITEDRPQLPVSPYGASKHMVERMLADFDAAYGLRHASLRYFNAAGADPDGETGECHDPETHAVPLAIQTALGRRPVFEVFGTDYPTPDGTAIRDYVHVSDLADAHVRAMHYLLDGGASVALNLGTGRGHSVLEVVGTVERVTERAVALQMSPRRPGDAPVLVADPRRAAQVLGWRPGFTDLAEIVRTAASWELKRSDDPARPPAFRAAS